MSYAGSFKRLLDDNMIPLLQLSEKAGIRMPAQRNQFIDGNSSRISLFRQYNTDSQGKVCLRITGKRLPHQTYFPSEWKLKTTKRTKQRRFTGTVQSQQTSHLARNELQVQILMDHLPLTAFQQVTDTKSFCFYCSYFCHISVSQSIGCFSGS